MAWPSRLARSYASAVSPLSDVTNEVHDYRSSEAVMEQKLASGKISAEEFRIMHSVNTRAMLHETAM